MENVFEAEHVKGTRHEPDTGPVQRSVDNPDIIVTCDGFRRKCQREYVLQISRIHILAHRADNSGTFSRDEPDFGRAADTVYLRHDFLVYRRSHLPPVGPEHLIAVVFFRIVGSRNHHPRHGLFQPYGITQLRSRPQAIEYIHIETIGRKHIRRYQRKFAAMVTVIMRNAKTGACNRMMFPDIIGKALRSHAHGVAVHPVRPGTHYPSKPSGTEFEVPVKRIFKRGRVP